VISSAQALSAPRTTRRSRALIYTTASSGLAFPTRVNPKIVIAASSLSVMALVILVLTHLGTYSVTMLHLPAQTDIQSSVVTQHPAATTVRPATSNVNASRALVRLNQSAVGQYASQAERDLWWGSTCSTASMTEVFDAYGYHYKITDVLQVESSIGAVAADSGLLYPTGIDDTALRFGFLTTTMHSPSISDVVKAASQGSPVIVNFPPHPWSAQAPSWTVGHFLTVVGGTASTVELADSSTVNGGAGLQTVSNDYFATYWHGYAKILKPSAYMVTHKPTVTVAAINALLASYHSPVAGQGQMIYDEAVKYGLDPAYVVSTFAHESTFGIKGEAQKSFSPGNLRCIASARCADGYAQFDSWQAGFDALCKLVAGSLYAGDHRIIPELIIPRFAPSADNNDETAYIAALEHVMDVLRAGGTQI
jgi:hypothetical protein